MERRQTQPYRIIHLRTGRVFDFTNAAAVANHLFVFGNFDLPNFPIFKQGRRWRQKAKLMEVSALARALEAF